MPRAGEVAEPPVLMAAPFTDEIRRGKVNHDAWERGYYGKKQGRG